MGQHVRYVKPVAVQTARGQVAQVYAQMKRDLGIIPEPFTLHSPVPELLAGIWSIFRESLLAGRVRRGVKEAVAATVSESNRCPWCVDAHTIVLYATGERGAVEAIMHRHPDKRVDAHMQAIIRWAASTWMPGAPMIVHPPFAPQDAPEMIGTAVTFHYLNRMVSAVLSETFLPRFPWLKESMKRMLGWAYAGSARTVYPPGSSLALLPEAELPSDLSWARATPHIAAAFARFAAVIERVGTRSLSQVVRDRVQEHIHRMECGGSWTQPPMGRASGK